MSNTTLNPMGQSPFKQMNTLDFEGSGIAETTAASTAASEWQDIYAASTAAGSAAPGTHRRRRAQRRSVIPHTANSHVSAPQTTVSHAAAAEQPQISVLRGSSGEVPFWRNGEPPLDTVSAEPYTTPTPAANAEPQISMQRVPSSTAAMWQGEMPPRDTVSAEAYTTPPPTANAQPQVQAEIRQRGSSRVARTARQTDVFDSAPPRRQPNARDTALQQQIHINPRGRAARLTDRIRLPHRQPGRRVLRNGLVSTILRTVGVILLFALCIFGIIANWNLLSALAMEFIVSWIISFVVLTYAARRFLQINQIVAGATILSVIAVVLLNNVFGIGTAMTQSIAAILIALLPLAILIFGLLLLIRSMFPR